MESCWFVFLRVFLRCRHLSHECVYWSLRRLRCRKVQQRCRIDYLHELRRRQVQQFRDLFGHVHELQRWNLLSCWGFKLHNVCWRYLQRCWSDYLPVV